MNNETTKGGSFFFFWIEFQSIVFGFDDCSLYRQTKTLIDFWCKCGLNHRSLIQSLETLLVELTRIHSKCGNFNIKIEVLMQKYKLECKIELLMQNK